MNLIPASLQASASQKQTKQNQDVSIQVHHTDVHLP